ncbi:DUF1214 domain-containing protein [Parahaliea mediterranea]|uniref:DUF1214 domain-containing protein n=1 Tax=Parahaliea mediterranea TaxID=651086 RepID=UPI00130026CC|nr:DUF1214 domain-containing protein [Parahaliea mediterranea]
MALSSLPLGTNAAAKTTLASKDVASRAKAVTDSIGEAVQRALRRTSDKTELGQASGALHVLSNLNLGLAMNMYNADPLNPTVFNYMNTHVKQGGDNADAFYSGFAVDARYEYRLYGNLGTASYSSFTTVEHADNTPWGGGMGAALYNHELQVSDNGDFELTISARPRQGNWLKITDRDFRITIRQFFADWENEVPMRVTVERIGASEPAPYRSAEQIMQALEHSARWTDLTVDFWQDAMDMFRKYPNEFRSWRELTGDGVNATPGGDPENCFWQVPHGKALILRVRPPECRYWNLEFNNPWWETMDYRFFLSGTNAHHAVLEDDGELIAVIAHSDPGLPNWLETCGHTEGMMGRRWMFADKNPRYTTELVDHEALFRHLPSQVKKITPDERKRQRDGRLQGLYRRFQTL